MRRWIICAAAAVLLMISPVRGMDISQLSPVQTVWVAVENGQVYLQTDGGEWGSGTDIASALENLNETAAGVVFLETADYLILQKGEEALLEQAPTIFRPSCMVCVADEMPDLEQATAFLRLHEPSITLRQWSVEGNLLQQLTGSDGRFAWDE